MDENIMNDSAQDVQVAPEAGQQEEASGYSQPEESGSSSSESDNVVASAEEMSLIKDPETGKLTLKFNDEDAEESQDEEAAEPQPQEETQGPAGSELASQGQEQLEMPKYNLEEFSQALADGYVDASRVPEQYQGQYADYKIRQAIMERQARAQQAAMEAERQRRAIEAQMTPENRIKANKDFYKALEEEASAAAMKDVGVTPEYLKEHEFDADESVEENRKRYEEAVAWHKQRLRGEMQAKYQAEQNYKHQQQMVYEKIDQFIKAERAKEPNFAAIDMALINRYKSLPYDQGKKIEAALIALQNGTINDDGVQVVEQYYNDCRREFYAQRNGLKANGAQKVQKKPPVVEGAGTGQKVNSEYKPNYSKLRSATLDQRKAWLNEYFANKGW